MIRALALVLVAACSSPASQPDAPAGPWFEGAPMPGPRLEPGVTAHGQRLIVAGGFDQSAAQGLRITNQVIAFDPAINAWSPLASAPVEWTHVNLAASGGTLYILGGQEGTQYTSRGEAYALDIDVMAPQWRQLRSMPAGQERGAAAIVVSPPHVFLLGGASSTAALATCLDYDLSRDEWKQLPDLPAPRSHPAAMRMNDGTLIIAGGLATLDAQSAAADVWALPPGATVWQPRAAMPYPRGGCAYGTVLGQLVCAGGESGQAALYRADIYDPIADTWTMLPGMPDARAGTQGAVIGGRLYVPGGARELLFIPESSLYVFSLADVGQ